ncbi:MAG: DNA repair protein RadC [Thermodesulfobacteriaceae bacterium]|nr:DNA repair protein RadC [Thermodesulfobacteriaceae bacterium]MCX8041854.1 DNA repair protein RadC [Thermodesulfobacteriaceae bacterium]MDW8135659.1 DNA repair protein RadC [Thermodesulfobacterium sp.]
MDNRKLISFYEKAKGHRERVKKRFLEEGPQSFTDEDLLELLLFFNLPFRDTRKLARELLQNFKSLDKVLDASFEELVKIKGLGSKAVLPLKVIHEVAKRYLKSKALQSEYLRSPQEVYQYLQYEMKNLSKEVFKVIFLDALSRVLGIETLFEGTLTESVVYPREIFAKVLEKRAVSLILVHNHPSGNLKPSKADLAITKKLILAGNLLQFKILDHLIISKEGYFSMAEEGIMEKLERELEAEGLWK